MRTKPKPAVLMADKLAREFVLERDGARCVCCGTDAFGSLGGSWHGSLEWAHIISRGARHLRWDPDNAVTLCHGDHAYFTDHPVRWRHFIAKTYGGDRWDDLKRRQAEAERRGDKVDVQAVIAFYRDRLTPKEADAYRNGEW
jgi:hypothetical protein